MPAVKIGKVNVDDDGDLAVQFGIRHHPASRHFQGWPEGQRPGHTPHHPATPRSRMKILMPFSNICKNCCEITEHRDWIAQPDLPELWLEKLEKQLPISAPTLFFALPFHPACGTADCRPQQYSAAVVPSPSNPNGEIPMKNPLAVIDMELGLPVCSPKNLKADLFIISTGVDKEAVRFQESPPPPRYPPPSPKPRYISPKSQIPPP